MISFRNYTSNPTSPHFTKMNSVPLTEAPLHKILLEE